MYLLCFLSKLILECHHTPTYPIILRKPIPKLLKLSTKTAILYKTKRKRTLFHLAEGLFKTRLIKGWCISYVPKGRSARSDITAYKTGCLYVEFTLPILLMKCIIRGREVLDDDRGDANFCICIFSSIYGSGTYKYSVWEKISK